MEDQMNKSMIAILIAFLITACVGAFIFVIGGAALFNKNGVTAANSPVQASNVASVSTSQQTDQVAQLKSLVAQYQDREKQYQQREQQLQDQLNQANTELQQAQETIQQARMLLNALQQRGLIRITNDGQIFINQ